MSQQSRAQVGPFTAFLDKPVPFGPYYLISELGEGAFGRVYIGVRRRDLDDRDAKGEQKLTCRQLFDSGAPKWAVKRFAKDKAVDAKEERLIATHAKQEIAGALRLMKERDPGLAELLQAATRHILTLDREVEDPENETTALVYEYCNLGDLTRLLAKFKDLATPIAEHELINIALQICDGLRLLKAAKVVHCDLFLRNVFLDWDPRLRKYTAKIGDFGQCRDLGDTKTTKLRSVFSVHIGPEVDGKTEFNEQADIYSFGVMLYELMARKEIHVPSRRVGTPFEEAAIEQERKTMESELRESKELRQLYPRLLPLAAAMVERDPARRPTADGIPTRLAFSQIASVMVDRRDVNHEQCKLVTPAEFVPQQNCVCSLTVRDFCAEPVTDAARIAVRVWPEGEAKGDAKRSQELKVVVESKADGRHDITFLPEPSHHYLLVETRIDGVELPGSPVRIGNHSRDRWIPAEGIAVKSLRFKQTGAGNHHVTSTDAFLAKNHVFRSVRVVSIGGLVRMGIVDARSKSTNQLVTPDRYWGIRLQAATSMWAAVQKFAIGGSSSGGGSGAEPEVKAGSVVRMHFDFTLRKLEVSLNGDHLAMTRMPSSLQDFDGHLRFVIDSCTAGDEFELFEPT